MKNICQKGILKKLGILVVFLSVLISTLTACNTESTISSYYNLVVVEHTSDFYVNDFAGLFSEEQKQELMSKAVAFDEEYSGIQVVITTVNSLDEAVLEHEYVVEDADGNRVQDANVPSGDTQFTIEQVAYSMYNQYGIGRDDMGILILFSTGDREVRIETGRQMQFYITDSISGRLLDDYGMDYFVDNNFAEGLISVQKAVIDEIKAQVSTDWHTTTKENSVKSENVAIGAVTSNPNRTTSENVAVGEKTEEKNSGNVLLWGFFGSIIAVLAAIALFIIQKFKSKAEKESLEKSKQEEVDSLKTEFGSEINSLKTNFQYELDKQDRIHNDTLSSVKSDYQETIREKDGHIKRLERDLSDVRNSVTTLTTQLEVITDKYNRVQRLHPEYNFDEEVLQMIESEYKEAAQELDRKLAKILATPANKDNCDVFSNALALFDSTRPEVKKYVTSKRANIQTLYVKAFGLKEEFKNAEKEKRDKATAKAAYDKIKSIYDNNPQGNYQNYSTLHAALEIFLRLSMDEKAFFPNNNLISDLKRRLNTAEEDHDNFETAKTAESNVKSIIGNMYSADEDDRDRLKKAMTYYRNLTSVQQAYFSAELLRKLKKLIDEADEDHRRQERRREDERRARAMINSSTSSFHSNSFSSSSHHSYTGHGGHSGGGGATRRF